MGAYIEHAAYKVADFDWYLRFFSTVYNMKVIREAPTAAGFRQAWLDGGVQLCEVPSFVGGDGRSDHLCLLVDDLESCRTKALAMGCTEMPKHHWVMLPDGLQLEMFPAAEGTVDAMLALPKRKATKTH